MSFLSDNLKFLIWKNKGDLSQKTYGEYIEHIAIQCKMEPERLRQILRDEASASGSEVAALSVFFEDYGYDLAAIQYMPLFDELVKKAGNALLAKNIQYLLQSLTRGKNAEFIESIGVNPSTVSRWKQGTSKPDPHSQSRICAYFGYTDPQILKSSFLFLGLEPVSTEQRKQKCRDLIESMEKESFEEIYPALVKLLN